jgi:hypothetical protein
MAGIWENLVGWLGIIFNEKCRTLLVVFSLIITTNSREQEGLDGPAVSALSVWSRKLSDVNGQWPVIGWVTKIYYFELFRTPEGTLRCWSLLHPRWFRLHLQSLAPTPNSRRVDVGRRSVVKINAESLSQHDEKHVVPIPLSGIRIGRRKQT